jgi:hypothetical protein
MNWRSGEKILDLAEGLSAADKYLKRLFTVSAVGITRKAIWYA